MASHSQDSSLIYQYFVGRHEQAQLEKHSGRVLQRMATHRFEALTNAGFTHVYLLGLWDNTGPILVDTEEDKPILSPLRLPSPFALRAMGSVSPALGNKADLRQLIDRIHSVQLKVLVDFVPNHTGTTHAWVNTHPEYYAHVNGKPVTEFSGDVYKLNYENTQLRQEMLEILLKMAAMNIDGVRCDMAHLVPNDFWEWVIEQVKGKYPDFIFVAEAYSESVFDWGGLECLKEIGFDMLYHEFLFRNLRRYFLGEGTLSDIVAHVEYYLHHQKANNWLHYSMNHDDYLNDATEFGPALLWLVLLLPGNALVYNGQILGLSRRLAHHSLDMLPASQDELDSPLPNWFDKLAELKAEKLSIQSMKLRKDGLIQLTTSSEDTGILLNLSNQPVKMNSLGMAGEVKWSYGVDHQVKPGGIAVRWKL